MNKLKTGLFFLIISMCILPSVHAAPLLKTLAPWSGDSQTEILAIIRPEKRTDNTPMHLYIFWNDLPIITRLCDTVINKQHTYMWDVTFKPPQDPRYLKKGSNKIVFWLEDIDGKFQTYTCIFTITDRIPLPSWLDDLSTGELDKLRGAEGPQGETGETGPRGPQGGKGDEGPLGPTGPKGDRGNIGPQGDEGPAGPAGKKGLTGDQGPEGERGKAGSLNIFVSGATILMSIAAIIISIRKGGSG